MSTRFFVLAAATAFFSVSLSLPVTPQEDDNGISCVHFRWDSKAGYWQKPFKQYCGKQADTGVKGCELTQSFTLNYPLIAGGCTSSMQEDEQLDAQGCVDLSMTGKNGKKLLLQNRCVCAGIDCNLPSKAGNVFNVTLPDVRPYFSWFT